MGRERQKKKNRSSNPKVRPKIIGRTKAGKKKVNFLGNETIAKNWDRSLTLEQNYKRLGLSSRLNTATGGTEQKKVKRQGNNDTAKDSLAIAPARKAGKLVPGEVQVERDPETGRIIRIIRPEGEAQPQSNPLNDPLNDLMDVEDEEKEKENRGAGADNIVSQLEAEAAEQAVQEAKKKRPRQQSQREEEWIAKLIQAHGENTAAMFRDRKLNPMQQSEGDIAKRLKKYQQKHG